MKNGVILYDTDGNELHAHGGHMLFHDGCYYWYGEDRRDNIYVSCYRSVDLEHWDFVCHSLTTDSPAAPYRVRTDLALSHTVDGVRHKVNIERPKVLYNRRTGKFVMWMHYENGMNYHEARCAVATSDTPDGEFTYHGSFNPYGAMSRDCTLFEDGDTAYFLSASRDNADLHLYRLSEDYLNVEELVKSLWQGEYREAPAVFQRAGKYYMLSSFCTGWAPNQGKYASADSMEGRWSMLHRFGDETTYHSQPAFVLPLKKEDGEHFYYIADRWDAKNYFASTYVFLEIQFDGEGNPYIEDADECSLG
ncbi:MAG: family 43 glycosylhydrolase [Eubacteriales bacterium]